MRIVLAPDIADWFVSWNNVFEWDSANLLKLEKHGFSKDDVETYLGLFRVGDPVMEKRKNTTQDFDDLFENTDFGDTDVEGVIIKRKGRPPIGRKFNVVMSEGLINLLEKAGQQKGVGYQTMVRIICSENIEAYLKKKDGSHKKSA